MKEIGKLEDLLPDASNANEGTLRGDQLLARSFENHGAGRSIVVDRNGVVIGGNKALDVAVDRGLAVKVVKSDGQRLIVVQRTDLDLAKTPRARELAYLDNRASEVGLAWNPAQIERDLASGLELGSMFTEAERDVLLAALDERERATVLTFDDPGQYDQWLAFVVRLNERYSALPTLSARLVRWVADQADYFPDDVDETDEDEAP